MSTSQITSSRLLLLLAVLALLLVACGGADETTSASETDEVADVGSDPEVPTGSAGTDAATEPATDDDDTSAVASEAITEDLEVDEGPPIGSETAAPPANPDSEFCTAITAFTEAISEEPQNPEEGEAYLAEALTQLDAVAGSAPHGAEDTVADVTAYFEEFDAALASVGYDIEAVDDEAIAAAAETYAAGLGDFETLVQTECGISLSSG